MDRESLHSLFCPQICLYLIALRVALCVFQPDTYTTVLEYSNIFFSGLFAVEMLLKIVAEGLFSYFKNLFNLFDGFIVILRHVR